MGVGRGMSPQPFPPARAVSDVSSLVMSVEEPQQKVEFGLF